MHGLGDTCDGWAQGMPELGIPNTKFILPTASSRPISINGGHRMPGWSDIHGLDSEAPEDSAGFAESADRINKIINQEITDHQIDPKRIVVAGFSQGGALALHVSLRFPEALGGCVALSTWLPLREDYPAAFSASQAALSILQVHGDSDHVVAHRWGAKSHEFLKTLITGPVKPEFRTVSGMGHSSDPQEMEWVSDFIKNIFEKE